MVRAVNQGREALPDRWPRRRNRTRDGGKTFELLRRGLPQEYAYDLVYRHALDIDTDGATLAFGSTTGNLFVSEDQGDSWQNVSHYLPPIYCVRFVN